MDAGKSYKRIFRAAFNYLERADKELFLAEAEALDEVWDKVASEGADLLEQGGCDAFMVDMFIAITDELYRRYFEQAEGGEG